MIIQDAMWRKHCWEGKNKRKEVTVVLYKRNVMVFWTSCGDEENE